MRSDKQTLSLHYFHAYAVKDRLNLSHLSDAAPTSEPSPPEVIATMLPNSNDDMQIHHEFAVLVAQMICTHHFLQGLICRCHRLAHATQVQSRNVEKSVVVSPALLALNSYRLWHMKLAL